MINIGIIILSFIIFEAITLIGRYILKIRGKKVFKKGMKFVGWKKVLHVHHFFIGLIAAIVFYFLNLWFWFNVAIGYALSDLIHHFVILKNFERDDEFDLIEKIPKKK